jgi:hypothetical protein
LSLREFTNFHDITKEDNKTKGKMSKKTSKRVKKVIDIFCTALGCNLLKNGGDLKDLHKKIKFITLTLSAKQAHSDKFIRRYMLEQFIQILKRKENVKSYIYCSEAQKNGNIHFHIITNKFISHQKIRKYWNKIQAQYGYIDRFEKKHGHRDPNSTDIHKLNKIYSLPAYLTKYFTKDEHRREIRGHLWGCSNNLKEMQYFSKLVDYDTANSLDFAYEKEHKNIYESDFFVIFANLNFEDLQQHSPETYSEIIEYYNDLYNGM